jgi:hypothetical protein
MCLRRIASGTQSRGFLDLLPSRRVPGSCLAFLADLLFPI